MLFKNILKIIDSFMNSKGLFEEVSTLTFYGFILFSKRRNSLNNINLKMDDTCSIYLLYAL